MNRCIDVMHSILLLYLLKYFVSRIFLSTGKSHIFEFLFYCNATSVLIVAGTDVDSFNLFLYAKHYLFSLERSQFSENMLYGTFGQSTGVRPDTLPTPTVQRKEQDVQMLPTSTRTHTQEYQVFDSKEHVDLVCTSI